MNCHYCHSHLIKETLRFILLVAVSALQVLRAIPGFRADFWIQFWSAPGKVVDYQALPPARFNRIRATEVAAPYNRLVRQFWTAESH